MRSASRAPFFPAAKNAPTHTSATNFTRWVKYSDCSSRSAFASVSGESASARICWRSPTVSSSVRVITSAQNVNCSPGFQLKLRIWSSESPTNESPQRSAWSTKVKGRSRASVTNHNDMRASSTAKRFLSTPYKHFCATSRRAWIARSGTVAASCSAVPSRVHAATTWSARKRHASTRKAPEPTAGSHTLSSRIASALGASPRHASSGSKVRATIGADSDRGV